MNGQLLLGTYCIPSTVLVLNLYYLLSPQTLCLVNISILQIRKLRLREVRSFAQGQQLEGGRARIYTQVGLTPALVFQPPG